MGRLTTDIFWCFVCHRYEEHKWHPEGWYWESVCGKMSSGGKNHFSRHAIPANLSYSSISSMHSDEGNDARPEKDD